MSVHRVLSSHVDSILAQEKIGEEDDGALTDVIIFLFVRV